jgi:hypothetical protein
VGFGDVGLNAFGAAKFVNSQFLDGSWAASRRSRFDVGGFKSHSRLNSFGDLVIWRFGDWLLSCQEQVRVGYATASNPPTPNL